MKSTTLSMAQHSIAPQSKIDNLVKMFSNSTDISEEKHQMVDKSKVQYWNDP